MKSRVTVTGCYSRRLLITCLGFVSALAPLQAGSRSSANYSITTETIDAGGVNAQSANYSLRGNGVGEFGAGSSDVITSAAYTGKIAYTGQLSDMLDPITAVSRKIHGSAGTFDIDLPLFGTPGIECRTALSGSSYTIVFTFANPLTSVSTVSATTTGGPQPGATGNIDNTDTHRYLVNVSEISNAQYTTIALSNVQDSDANSGSIVQTKMGVLLGDVNGDGFVLSGDYTAVRQKSGAGANGSNFRLDINADGFILSGDYTTTRQQSGMHLP
jgi:hypothetical protein